MCSGFNRPDAVPVMKIPMAAVVAFFALLGSANANGKHIYLIAPVEQRNGPNNKADLDRATRLGELVVIEFNGVSERIEVRVVDRDSPDPSYRACPKPTQARSCDTVVLREEQDVYPLSINNTTKQLVDGHGAQKDPLKCERGGDHCWPRAFNYAVLRIKQHHAAAHAP
jgi:hypothetical protein